MSALKVRIGKQNRGNKETESGAQETIPILRERIAKMMCEAMIRLRDVGPRILE